jgi:protein phosphatase
VKNNEEASWMKVPIEGDTPGLRYGHTMVYIMPILILFGGSGESEILNDIWIMSTDKTPFKWEKIDITTKVPLARVYHSANLYKVAGNSEMMIIFGGRCRQNNSLCDVMGIKKDTNNNWEWTDFSNLGGNESGKKPIGRHQQCSAFFGPFLFVVGGRAGGKESASFDVFSMNKYKWYRFGNINLFRHSIWVYNNIISEDKYEVYLYIYGGFDGDNNSQINPHLYRVNIVELFSNDETLKNELNDHISMILLIQRQKKNRQTQLSSKTTGENKNVFTLNHRAIISTMDNNNDFANNIRTLSIAKLPEEGRKILENKPGAGKKNYVYDENLVKEFLELMPLPEQFIPLAKNDRPIILNRDYVLNLISQAKSLFEKTSCLLNLQWPIKIFGSIHGQYNDLIRFFNVFGRPSELRGDIDSFEYLFLGNFVNRGGFSIEVLCLLLALKVNLFILIYLLV